ncbi:hypothetical protein [Belnapia sp. F-4-1]|uniref:hypothetical protein n=1 Tax=Belnapia sp. F-4-1 TaxID=1545443 RepID=UPI0005BAB4AC|nr:hypothetical protein [Belnapia sp. F-4-1]
MSAKMSSSEYSQRLSGPTIYTAMDAAVVEGNAWFGLQMNAVLAEMKSLFVKRWAGRMTTADAVRLMELDAKFKSLSVKQSSSSRPFIPTALLSRQQRDG